MRKRDLCALAALGACAALASAQSTVAVYGVLDAGLVAESGGAAGSVTKLSGGIGSGSRLGFRGTEDLGDGLAAVFLLESGIANDTGALGQGGLLFGRQAYVGLKNAAGEVTLGRQYTPYFMTLLVTGDPFKLGFAGTASNLMSITGARTNNTLRYATPVVQGFSAELAYGFGETAGNASGSRALGWSARYAEGALDVRLAHHVTNNAAATDHARNTLLAANYKFGAVTANAGYAVNQGMGAVDSVDFLIGGSIPLGAGRCVVSHIRKDDRSAANRDASQLAVGYMHNLSKRTELYAAVARIRNTNGGAYTVGNNSEPGSGNKAANIGMRHFF